MIRKPIDERTQAKRDIEAAVDYYLREGGSNVAMAFLDNLQAAYLDIAEYPAAGSPRYGEVLKIKDLRSRTLHPYPYLVLYIEREDHVDVWRVLHGHRDVPQLMQEP